MTTQKLIRNIILCGFMAASLLGQGPTKAPKTPILISSGLVDAVSGITPPPALDSQTMNRDIAEIYALHRSVTPQEMEAANWDNKHENLFAIAKVLDNQFTQESLPATAALWADMDNDQSIVVSAAKKYFQHPRPYDLDSNIKSICGSRAGGPKNSYPSGHGTVGYLSAIVLSMMVPERAQAIHARAEEFGHNRVICGDHYASDIPASKEAAELIMGNMMGNPRFQREFAAAKAEVRRALGM